MTATYIPVIMDLVDKIISEDRKRKYSNALVVKILLIIQTYGISYRSTEKFFKKSSRSERGPYVSMKYQISEHYQEGQG